MGIIETAINTKESRYGEKLFHPLTASGEYDGHIINEIKLIVPVQELIRAEEILRELKIIDEAYLKRSIPLFWIVKINRIQNFSIIKLPF